MIKMLLRSKYYAWKYENVRKVAKIANVTNFKVRCNNCGKDVRYTIKCLCGEWLCSKCTVNDLKHSAIQWTPRGAAKVVAAYGKNATVRY